jgi:hypothetical protein
VTMTPATIEAAIARVSAIADVSARAAARDALSAVLALHAEGLRRLCERLRDVSGDADSVLHAIAEDEVVSNLLLLHDLHPTPLGARVRRALEDARPKSDVTRVIELVSAGASVVRVRVTAATERLGSKQVVDRPPRSTPEGTHREATATYCEPCGQPLAKDHEHLLDLDARRLTCACAACALLFDSDPTKMRRVRTRQTLPPPPLRAGTRVRLHPKLRADVLDLALEGKNATVHSVEHDFEGRTYVAVTVDPDDAVPRRDLGVSSSRRRFFFGLDELVVLDNG